MKMGASIMGQRLESFFRKIQFYSKLILELILGIIPTFASQAAAIALIAVPVFIKYSDISLGLLNTLELLADVGGLFVPLCVYYAVYIPIFFSTYGNEGMTHRPAAMALCSGIMIVILVACMYLTALFVMKAVGIAEAKHLSETMVGVFKWILGVSAGCMLTIEGVMAYYRTAYAYDLESKLMKEATQNLDTH